MSNEPSINSILSDLRAHVGQSGDTALQERVRQLEAALPGAGGSISVGNISGSTAVAIGSDIRILVNQTVRLPDNLLNQVTMLLDSLDRRARSFPPAAGHIRVFLASPGDVKDERKLALKAIDKIQADPFCRGITVEAVAWDRPGDSIPMLYGIDPQSAINQELKRPSECDIFTAIFWSRMGTPLDPSRYRKPDGSQYLSGTDWELGDALESFTETGRPLLLVYRRTEKILLDPDAPDFDEKALQRRRVQEFFATAKNADGSIRFGINDYASPSEFGDQFELHLRKEIARLVEEQKPAVRPAATRPSHEPAWPKDKSPFPGLRAFGPQDEIIFFGRGAETDLLVSRLSDPACRFLVVVGASGSGKSSLVGAGLLPRLRSGAQPGSEQWPVITFTPDILGSGDPFGALTWALSLPPLALEARQTGQRLRRDCTGLRQILDSALAERPDWVRAVLFIDQFEELFTRITDDSLRQAFIAALDEAARSARILIVVTLRDDFYHYCVKSPLLSALINRTPDSTFPLSAPGVLSLHEMITGPARVAGLEYEGGLAQRILLDTGTDPGALALMAYALDQLYKASAGQGCLAQEVYRAFGGVQGVIGARAQETFEKLDARAQAALPLVFRELLEVDESGKATRKRALLEHVQSDPACRELVKSLVEARLLTTSREAGGQALVEVAHEALFRSWPRLKSWIEEAQDDLILLRQVRAAAALWDKHERQPAYRWPDERLQPVYAMQKHLAPTLNSVEQEFIRSELDRLVEELHDPSVPHLRRSAIGERLNALGDRRPGVGLVRGILPLRPREESGRFPADELQPGEMRLWGDRPEHQGLPDIAWLRVDGGKLAIEEQIFTILPFYIAKYPITYTQFQVFLDAPDGFKDPRWWKRLDADSDHKNKPKEQNFKFNNHPRENVSWYDAIAFCRWLNDRLGWPGIPLEMAPQTLGNYKGLRLPAEWEWQWAASSGQAGFEYPWGREWDESRANTEESGLGRTTAVGVYPAGAAANGALDLSGNVWEWCLSEYGEPKNIGLGGSESRVLRGGSWYLIQDGARAVARFSSSPGNRDFNVGFRVVVRPPSL